MKIIRQFGIILLLWLFGELISMGLKIPVPGSVIGMVLLFICLYSGVIKVEMLDELSSFLLDNLAFFFIPLGVGLLESLDIFKANWLPITLIVLLTTIIVVAVTGLTVQLLAKERNL